MSTDERHFLHDLSNPVAIAVGMVEILLKQADRDPNPDPKRIERLNKTLEALQRAVQLLENRRKALETEKPSET